MHFFHPNSARHALLAVASAYVLLAGSASAQTQSESFSINAPLQCLGSTGSFSLPDFDTSLGSLQSIDLTLTINSCFSVQVYNSAANPENFLDATLTLNGSVQGGGTTLTTSVTSTVPSGTSGSGINTYATPHATTVTNGSVDPSLFTLWQDQSGGQVNFTYNKGNPAFGGIDVGGDNLFFGGKVRGTGQVTVEYTYLAGSSAVPEPSTKYLSAVAAGAMVALFFFHRKRREWTGIQVTAEGFASR